MSTLKDYFKPKKRVKKGIFGHPSGKRNRILFFVKDVLSSESDEAENDEAFDSDYEPLDVESKQSDLPRKKIVRSSRKSKPDEVEKSTNGPNWSNGLPYEVLYQIFEYIAAQADGDLRQLEQLKHVCKYWFTVGNDPRLCAKLVLSKLVSGKFVLNPAESHKKEKKFDKREFNLFNVELRRFLCKRDMIEKFKFVQCLDLSNLIYLTCDGLHSILENCNSKLLGELNLAHCQKITVSTENRVFEETLANQCPNLLKLNISGQPKEINYQLMCDMFLRANIKLKSLNMAQNSLPQKLLNYLGDQCDQLEELDISNATIKGVLDLDYLSEKCPKLKRLYMHGCSCKTKFNNILSVTCSPISFANLEDYSIAFSGFCYGTNPLIYVLTKVCKDAEKLKVLDIITYKSPLDSYLNLFSMFKTNKLEKLSLCNSNLSEADNSYLPDSIANKWSDSLVDLNLSWSNIGQDGLEKIFDAFSRNSAKCKLRNLNLTGTCVNTNMIMKLIKKVRTLKMINLTSCRSIDRGFKKILDETDIKKLIKS